MEQLLYELRPFLLYIGAFLTLSLDHPVKWVSVFLLFSASFLVLSMREISRNGCSFK